TPHTRKGCNALDRALLLSRANPPSAIRLGPIVVAAEDLFVAALGPELEAVPTLRPTFIHPAPVQDQDVLIHSLCGALEPTLHVVVVPRPCVVVGIEHVIPNGYGTPRSDPAAHRHRLPDMVRQQLAARLPAPAAPLSDPGTP